MERIDHALPPISFDQTANQACRQNNQIQLKNENNEPELGGNIAYYKGMLGASQKTPEAEENTIVGWSGTAHELIILNLLNEFEKTQKPAILDPKTTMVGMSF